MDKLLTPDELCEICKIKKSKLYKLTSRKIIPFIKIGRELRFQLEKVIERLEVETIKGRILL